MPILNRTVAEFIGTFWLVFGGCGSAVFAAAFPEVGIGLLGVSLAFGLTLLTMVYAIGHLSGCHLNPAVTLGLAVGKRFAWGDVPVYVIAQVLGAILAAYLIWIIAAGQPGFTLTANSLAVNGYGSLSPGGYSLAAGFITEVVLTMLFLFIILGATDPRAPAASAGVAIGLALTLIHLISIPITNTSVNPARSTGPAFALMTGGEGQALGQLWLFWVGPLIGAALGGLLYPLVAKPTSAAASAPGAVPPADDPPVAPVV